MPSEILPRAAPCPGAETAPSAGGPPLLPDVGVLALVPERWGSIWQLRHQVLPRLARFFHVVWASPPREWHRWERRGRPESAAGPRPPGFALYEPEFWLPKLYRPSVLATLTSRWRLARARAMLEARGCRRILLYIWRPAFADALGAVRHDQSYYHIDDEYSFSDVEVALGEDERSLIAAVDHVFVTSPALLAKKGGINPHTALIPNGVDYRTYVRERPVPPDLAAVPRPRIGYAGVIKRQLDWPLLRRLAEGRPDWSVVFVGPVPSDAETRAAIDDLARRPNVHFLGCKLPAELPAYVQHFDVGLMPYRVNGYTRYIYPLKLHEYLASGRPAVGARISSLEDLPGVVAVATDLAGWQEAIDAALQPAANTAEIRAARQAVAQEHDWGLLVRRIARTMAAQLGTDHLARFERATNPDGTGESPDAGPYGQPGGGRRGR